MKPLLILCLLLLCPLLKAQPTQTADGKATAWDFGITTGPYMSTGVLGITEILPYVGFRVSKNIGSFRPELVYGNARGDGNELELILFSFKGDIDTGSEDVGLHWLFGINSTRWDPAPEGGQRFQQGGWHLGGGFTWAVAGPAHLRSDFFIGRGPGFVSYIGVGIDFLL